MPLPCRLVSYSSVYFNYARACLLSTSRPGICDLDPCCSSRGNPGIEYHPHHLKFCPAPSREMTTQPMPLQHTHVNGAQPRKPAGKPGTQAKSESDRATQNIVIFMVMVMAIEMIQIDEPDAVRNEGKLTGQHTAQGPKKKKKKG
ncbi:hypothetical protein I7I48_05262 [Histoplasma ohiense]|nr:hypothetical protein I7I48_05262 [Histoplasma ohiense (nom. inval.)]